MSGTRYLPLAADQALPLEQLAGAWRLEGGFVDIFAVRRLGGQLLGRREFLVRVPQGGFLCATEAVPDEPAVALLAVGGMDALLVATADTAAAAADAWVGAVDDMLRDPARGWTEHLATPGEVTLAAHSILGCQGRQVLWAQVLKGLVAGPHGIQAGPGAAPMPITAATPLQALEPSHLLVRHSAELSAAELAAALAGHRVLLLAHAQAVLTSRAAARAERIAQSTEASARSMSAGLAGLSGLAANAAPAEHGGDPVWQAMARVAAALGQAVPDQPQGIATTLPVAERVAAHAATAGLRLRRVLLREDWWLRDHGPLLALAPGGLVPLALLPGRGGYRVADPASRHLRKLPRAEAERLEPEAWMLYRGFPPGQLGLGGLLRFMAQGLRQATGPLLLLALASALLGLAAPLASWALATLIIPKTDFNALLLLGGGMLAAALGLASLELTRALLLQRIEVDFALDTQAALFDRLLRLPVAFFRHFGAADLADRVLAMDQFRRNLGGAGLGGVLAGVVALANLGVMLACNLWLGVVGLAVAGLAFSGSLWLCLSQVSSERALAEHRGNAENLVLEAIAGVAKLKAAAAVERVFAVWARLYGRQHRAAAQVRRLANWQAVFTAGFTALGTMLLFLVAASIQDSLRHEALQATALAQATGEVAPSARSFTLGAWLAFACAFGQLMAGVRQAVEAVSSAMSVVPLTVRAQPILAAMPEASQGRQPPGNLSGALEFSRVSFGYAANAAPVLHELSFAVQPGEYIAIVGPSGSGKSTILRLLLGFETPHAGAVLYDGRPLSTLDTAAVRRQVGVVLQNSRLQPGTVLANIGGGQPIELEDAWAAAQLAGVAREIRALPMGMYTMLSEAGGTLSGGQRQRLLIARALARRPRLLLLDEATSALDNRTQSVVAEAVSGLGLTRVVVAHRLSTIAMVDRVLVLDRGRLVQQGRFEDLMNQPGLFQELARRQLS